MIIDLLIVPVAYLLPLVLRFDAQVPDDYWKTFRVFIPMVVALHFGTNYFFRLYGPMWRYASVHEARRLILAVASVFAVVLIIGEWFGGGMYPMPRSVLILGPLFAGIGFGVVRFQRRLFGFHRRVDDDKVGIRVLFMGAGEAGAMVLDDIRRHPSSGLRPVGFVDDDPRKRGRSLRGLPVLGGHEDIPEIASRLNVDQVLLTIPSATSELVREVAQLGEKAAVTLRVLPSVEELIGGSVSARDIRDLKIEDLLSRQQVHTDLQSVVAILRGRRVLVTGAGGSIGSELARQIEAFDPAELMLLDHDETHLHDLMSQISGGPKVRTVLADIRDRERLLSLFFRLRPEVVFHAAAHKHVPVLETYPEEALATNVLGTANVVDASVLAGVQRFVLISTDKAVKPSSVMGASKWLAEQIVRSVSGDCIFCAVRFGNVLGSRGSVVPLFLQQIQEGGPVTVTDADMFRYFMSIREAAQLVLQAAALSVGGEVLTLDMGEPVSILDLARKLIHLSGRVPDRDIRIEFTGVRPGEKLMEDLGDVDETPLPTAHPGIVMSRPPVPDRPGLRRAIRELESMAGEEDPSALGIRLTQLAAAKLAPEQQPPSIRVDL